MIIKDVKFLYDDKKYGSGPYIDFFGELTVPSLDYETIVKAVEKKHPDYVNVRVLSFTRAK